MVEEISGTDVDDHRDGVEQRGQGQGELSRHLVGDGARRDFENHDGNRRDALKGEDLGIVQAFAEQIRRQHRADDDEAVEEPIGGVAADVLVVRIGQHES